MAYNFGDSVGFPEADDDTPPLDSGRLAGWFCRLARREFTGLVQVETADKYVVFAFRGGSPVFVEDASSGESLAETLLERGLLTREQYGEIVMQMTDSLVENEDLMFGEQAVSLGYVSAQQVAAEMSERVRAKIIQAMSFTDCRVELDESPESLLGMGEYPQEVGTLVYMGVRTFYDEALLAKLVPAPERHYMRLTRPASSIVAFFGLDDDEAKLLRALDPESRVTELINSSIVEPDHARQLIALLHLAGLAELATSPFAPVVDPERSGVRSASDVMGAKRPRTASSHSMTAATAPEVLGRPRTRAASNHAMPAVTPSVEPQPSRRAPSQQRMPAVDPRVDSRSDAAVSGGQLPREESFGAARSRTTPAQRQPEARTAESSAPAAVPVSPRNVAAAPTAAATPASRPVAPAADDVAAQALAEAKARAGRARRLPGVGAVRRLGQELERMRGATAQESAPPTPATAAENPGYAKAHLQQLLRSRRQNGAQVSQPVATKRDPMQDFRQAQELLRGLQYARAEEILRGLTEQSPNDESFRVYHLWAKFRSTPELEQEQLVALRDLAKKLAQVEETAGFGAYVLAHLALAEKKDEIAEKLFRKAHSLDKTNKDAERHVLILERRKQQAAQAEAQANRKIFGISIAGAKDKDKD